MAIALSGGLDSRFLTHMALRAGLPVVALHASGPHMAPAESLWARRWAEKIGLTLHILDFQPLALEGVRTNSPERCYVCKQALIQCMHAALANISIAENHTGTVEHSWILCDGTNADDLSAHRPGLRALREGGVRSPLAECGITKDCIRCWAQETGMEQPQQVARPCLLTRLAYGMSPAAELLRTIATLEDALATAGLHDFRLRLTPAPLLQTRPLSATLRDTARTLLHQHGFGEAIIVEEEHIGGYFDREKA